MGGITETVGNLGGDHPHGSLTLSQSRFNFKPPLETALVAKHRAGLGGSVTAAVIMGIGYMTAWPVATLHLEFFRVVGLLGGDITEQVVDKVFGKTNVLFRMIQKCQVIRVEKGSDLLIRQHALF